MRTYTHKGTIPQTVHLEPTDPVAHLDPLECEEPHLLPRKHTGGCCGRRSWLRSPAGAPNPVSQPLPSSMVEGGRTAEQISLCFPTQAKAAAASTHQRRGGRGGSGGGT